MNSHQMDGHYILNFTKNDTISKTIQSGYYSNGFSFDNTVRYEIRNDTVLIKYKAKDQKTY